MNDITAKVHDGRAIFNHLEEKARPAAPCHESITPAAAASCSDRLAKGAAFDEGSPREAATAGFASHSSPAARQSSSGGGGGASAYSADRYADGREERGRDPREAAPYHTAGFDSHSWQTTDELEYETWGADHPDYMPREPGVAANPKAKARWSNSELRYIERWCTKHNSASMKDLLECIRGDPKARTIFHERHVLKTDRLRAGYLAYLTKAGLNDN